MKKLLYDKERAEERYEQADREATDLAEWIAFARSHNASENELMSFVKAFGDELLADVDMDQDPAETVVDDPSAWTHSSATGSSLAWPFSASVTYNPMRVVMWERNISTRIAT